MTSSPNGSIQITILAALVIIGSFGYIVVRGTADIAGMGLISFALGSVITWAFGTHIANGAATKALDQKITEAAVLSAVLPPIVPSVKVDPPKV